MQLQSQLSAAICLVPHPAGTYNPPPRQGCYCAFLVLHVLHVICCRCNHPICARCTDRHRCLTHRKPVTTPSRLGCQSAESTFSAFTKRDGLRRTIPTRHIWCCATTAVYQSAHLFCKPLQGAASNSTGEFVAPSHRYLRQTPGSSAN